MASNMRLCSVVETGSPSPPPATLASVTSPRMAWMFRRTTGREPSEGERADLEAFAQAQLAYLARAVQGTAYEGLPLLSAAAPFKAGGRQGSSTNFRPIVTKMAVSLACPVVSRSISVSVTPAFSRFMFCEKNA